MVAILGVSLLTGWADTLIFSGATLNWRGFLLGHLELVSLLLFVGGVGLVISAGAGGGTTGGGGAPPLVGVGSPGPAFGNATAGPALPEMPWALLLRACGAGDGGAEVGGHLAVPDPGDGGPARRCGRAPGLPAPRHHRLTRGLLRLLRAASGAHP